MRSCILFILPILALSYKTKTITKTRTVTRTKPCTTVKKTTMSTSKHLSTTSTTSTTILATPTHCDILEITPEIQVCLPPHMCNPETCPPTLGNCVADVCEYKNGYNGLATLPEAWATWYCEISTGGCQGVTSVEPVIKTAEKLAVLFNTTQCSTPKPGCVGIAASSPMLVGNSQEAQLGGRSWGLGLSEASNICYRLVGPGGDAIVALTDRCGGYCTCGSTMPNIGECGPCVSSPLLKPNIPCVSNGPQSQNAQCDWCANNNHAHFDLDLHTFNYVCGIDSPKGSCKFSKVEIVECCLLYTSPSPRDRTRSRMPSSA